MEELLESMCPCYADMDSLFCDKGNVTPFGRDHSDRETSNGHDHSNSELQHFESPDSKENEAYTEIIDSFNQLPIPDSPLRIRSNCSHDFLNNHLQSPSAAPQESSDPQGQTLGKRKLATNPAKGAPKTSTSQRKPPVLITRKPRISKASRMRDALTAEEQASDSSFDKVNVIPHLTTQATQEVGNLPAPRSTLSSHPIAPLPSIDPAIVHSTEHKHALADAIQKGNNTCIHMLAKATKVQEELESN
ncbi:hypothetical protein DFH28DRAFT_1123314 [Melampsora americana]|nr:hypothetical protein DFH28DRAFT_1123314 [Melampsora americana]